jgi:hypothetical protein
MGYGVVMAKQPHLTPYQRGIVKRYYENLDAIALSRLQELVSELAVAAEKDRPRLWKRVEQALGKAGVPPSRAAHVLASRDVTVLARLVGELAGGRG